MIWGKGLSYFHRIMAFHGGEALFFEEIIIRYMKKIILAMGLFLGSFGVANAQKTIKNGGLENWRTSKLLFNLTASIEGSVALIILLWPISVPLICFQSS